MTTLSKVRAVLAVLSVAVVVSSCGTDDPAPGVPENPEAATLTGLERDSTCRAAQSAQPLASPAQRLTTLARTAGRLLIDNGIVPGPNMADGSELTVSQAFDQASVVPGDASIIETLWVQQATADDIFQGLYTDLDAKARHIESYVVTDATLTDQLGPNWPEIVDVVEEFADDGFDNFVQRVRDSRPMRVPDALQRRTELHEDARSAGIADQWENAQSIATIYFQSCSSAARFDPRTSSDVVNDLESQILAEVLVLDAIAAAFVGGGVEQAELAEPLTAGLQIVLGSGPAGQRDDVLTKDFDPNEIMSPEDVELMELEEPSLDGP
ncbi:hypothetical protein [Rhodococcoides yunnanense]|uniref:hypothetical protein n=1 Tax=Rhodococcoides yunnanense TaxID=278209 RepID=UPI0022B11C62|nr:hypothetical protein [Rhodococcus yunnanensis]MCZ4278385.1 hypothetical protein [Rhodococcus yunnanensis]